MEDEKKVTFMQFCAVVTNFTRTSSRLLESIYQAVLLLHKTNAGDTKAKNQQEQELGHQIRELRDSTASVLIVLKNNFTNITILPPSQQLVLNASTSLIRVIIAFSNSAKKVESGDEIGKLYKDVLSAAKQAVSSINFSLKGSFVSEEQINTLVKNVKDVKNAATELEGKVRSRDKANYFTAARTFVNAVNDLMATSSEMGILEVNLEAKLKASVVGIMSAGKTALGSTWDSVTAIVSMHEGKEELYLILKDLLTKCSLSRKAAAIEIEKAGEIHMSLPSRTLSPMVASFKKSASASVPGSPNNSDLNLPRNFNYKPTQNTHPAPSAFSAPTSPVMASSPPAMNRSVTTPHFEIPASMLNLFATTDPSAVSQPVPEEDLAHSLSINVTPKGRNANITKEGGSRRSSVCVLERSVSETQARGGDNSHRKSVHVELTASPSEKQTARQRSISFGSGLGRRLGSTQTIMPPTETDHRRSDISTSSSILSSDEPLDTRGTSVHSDLSRGSKEVFTEVDLRGSWDIKQEMNANSAKKSKIKLALRKDPKETKEPKENKESRETKTGKDFNKDSKGKREDSKGRKEDSKGRSHKSKEVIDADVPLEEIVQRVTNAFVDQYSYFREEYHAQTDVEKARSMTIVTNSLQTKFPEIANNIPPPPPPPPKKTWKNKLIPSCFRPTRIKSVYIPPEKMGWS